MTLTLGQKLRQAREERGISIAEVAEQTRISPLYLDAIDKDEFNKLPGGIFNKGFVRSYAKFVGVDEQEAMQDYSRQTASMEDAFEKDSQQSYRPEVLTDDRTGTSIIPTIAFAVVILGLMTAGVLFLVNYIQNREKTPEVANTAVTSPTPPPSSANTNSNVAETPATTSQEPSMDSLRVEFKTTGDGISLNSVSDGAGSISLVTPDKPAVFAPKQQLKLSYSKSLASIAQLSINGKAITLPTAPLNPKRAVIEFMIDQENLASVWQSGAISFDSAANTAQPAANVSTGTQTATPAAAPPVTREEPRQQKPATTGRQDAGGRPTSTTVARPESATNVRTQPSPPSRPSSSPIVVGKEPANKPN